jgi:alpha-tubulin suppressor-like RCC1 family protein
MLALLDNGAVLSWGGNREGELGTYSQQSFT